MNREKTGKVPNGPFEDKSPGPIHGTEVFDSAQPHRRLERVSFRIRRVEYLIAWALTLGTAWTALTLFPGELAPWLATLFAAAIGAWSRTYPAQRPLLMLARASLLLCAALSLHTDATTGGPNGPYFFWPVAIAGTYALLLEGRLAIAVLALCTAEYLLALWLAPPAASLRPALSALGVLLIWPSIAILLSRSMHRADAEVESNLTDAQTNLYNETGLLEHGSVLFRQCRDEGRPISLVLLQCPDLRNAHSVMGRGATTQILARAMRGILSVAPGAAIAARIDTVQYALLLPDLSSQRAKALLQARLGSPLQVATSVRGRQVVILLDTAVSAARVETPSLEALFDRVRYKMQRYQEQNVSGTYSSTTDSSPPPDKRAD